MIIVQTTLFFLFLEIFSLLVLPFYAKNNRKLIRNKSVFYFLIFTITAIYVPFRIFYDYNSVEINEITYKKDSLPSSLNGLRIALVSDIQADRYTNKKRLSNYIEKLNSTKPDLVLMAGDMITSTPNFIEFSAKQLSKVKAKYGVYTCVGDHDNWAYRGRQRKKS